MAEKISKHARVISNSMKFLDGVDENFSDPKYIPESIQSSINNYVRTSRNTFDELTSAEYQYDKASDEHISIKKEKEHIAKSFITIKNQVDKYKRGIVEFKNAVPQMNKGTQDSNYFISSAINGNQWDELHIDKNGNFNFLVSPEDLVNKTSRDARGKFVETGGWEEENGGSVKLDDIPGIIQEPYGAKNHVFKLAEKTKVEKDSGEPFDDKWTYNSVLNNLTDAGANGAIGMAFTDLAGDSQTKSFAEMYEEGMKEEYYIHPDTGEDLPKGLLWMKDPNNADVLSKLLSRYVTNVMKDMHGGSSKRQSSLASELIKKYSK